MLDATHLLVNCRLNAPRISSTNTGSAPVNLAISSMLEKTHSPFSGLFSGVKLFDAS